MFSPSFWNTMHKSHIIHELIHSTGIGKSILRISQTMWYQTHINHGRLWSIFNTRYNHECQRKQNCISKLHRPWLHRNITHYQQHLGIIIIIFNLRTAAFKVYCAIWVRRSNFRHQASPRVSPRESTQRRKVKLWARNVRKICLNADFHVTFRCLLHTVKLRHGTDGFTAPPKEGVLRIFSP